MTLGPRIGSPTVFFILGPLFVVQFGIMLCVGLYFTQKSVRLVNEGDTAVGTVVAMDRGSKGSASPIVDFTTASGQRVRLDGIASSKPPAYTVGDKVRVYYLRTDPEYHALDSFSEMWLLPAVFDPLGLGGFVAGIICSIVGLRRRGVRQQIKTAGFHLVGVIVGAKAIRMKNSNNWKPEVEIRHPQTGAPIRCEGDQQRAHPMIGARAMVHIEPTPPHRHFVEL